MPFQSVVRFQGVLLCGVKKRLIHSGIVPHFVLRLDDSTSPSQPGIVSRSTIRGVGDQGMKAVRASPDFDGGTTPDAIAVGDLVATTLHRDRRPPGPEATGRRFARPRADGPLARTPRAVSHPEPRPTEIDLV